MSKDNLRINIIKPYLPDLENIGPDFAECLKSGMVTNNSRFVRMFEQKLQEYWSSKIKPLVFSNGEMALFSLIQAWKAKLGCDAHDSFEVLVPSFTFSGTVNAIVMNNLKPVFCDVDDTLTVDTRKLEGKLDKSIRMMVVVGAYGNLVDIERLGEICSQNSMVLIQDNAPAFGVTKKGKFPHEYGFSEIYSFHASKVLSSMEGGAAVVNDEEVAGYLSRLRDFGQYEKTRGDIDVAGLNSKMQEISAIVGIKNLEKIDQILSQRSKNIKRYVEFFGQLEKKGHLKNMRVASDVFCPYLYYPLVLNEEATPFVEHMQGRGVMVRRYYTAVHTLKYYKDRYRTLDLGYTDSIKDKIVSLPIHTEMEPKEMDHLFATAGEYFEGGNK